MGSASTQLNKNVPTDVVAPRIAHASQGAGPSNSIQLMDPEMAEVKGRPRVKTVVDKAKDKRNLQMLTLWGDRSYMHPVSQLPSPNKHLTYDKTAKEKAPSAM